MPSVPNQSINVGGNTLYPMQGLLDPNRPVYRPAYGTSGLLDTGDMDNLVRDFAGGLLNGYQVSSTPNASGQYVTPIAPSGVYTTDPDKAAPSTPQGQGGGMTYRDMLTAMYGSQLGLDHSNIAGGPGQQARMAQLILGPDGGVGMNAGVHAQARNNALGDIDLDKQYDADNEEFRRLMMRMSHMGSSNSGGQR